MKGVLFAPCHRRSDVMLKGVFYAEFDNIAGPKILYQAPDGFLSPDKFDGISDYVIMVGQLCGKHITVNAFGLTVMGYPLCINNEKYFRNALLFNVGFVFDAGTDTEPYQNALKKMALTLYRMELEGGFLFDVQRKALIKEILPRVLYGLNLSGECVVKLDDANLLCLRLFKTSTENGGAAEVAEYKVPILLKNWAVLTGKDSDLALQKVMPQMDGVKYAKKISLGADVDIGIVKRCLRALLYYECIALIDIYNFSNVYMATEKVHEFSRSVPMQTQCASFVARDPQSRPPPDLLIRLYCSCRPGKPLSDILRQHHGVLEIIDIRRLIAFGVLKGLLKRCHRHPICVPGSTNRPSTGDVFGKTQTIGDLDTRGRQAAAGQPQLVSEIPKKMDGTVCEDELCCRYMMSYDDLLSIATSGNNRVISIFKCM